MFSRLSNELVGVLVKMQKLDVCSCVQKELCFTELCILSILYMDVEPVNLSSLSKKIGVSKAAISQSVDKLDKKMYVERYQAEADRKTIYLRLTDKGKEYEKKNVEKIMNITDKIIDIVGQEDSENLIRIADKFIEAARSVLKEEKKNA